MKPIPTLVFALIGLIISSGPAFSEPLTNPLPAHWIAKPGEVLLTYKVYSFLHSPEGSTSAGVVTATVEAGRVRFGGRVSAASFKSSSSGRDENMRKALETDKFADIVITGEGPLCSPSPSCEIPLDAGVTLHGVTQPYRFPVKIEPADGNRVRATFQINLAIMSHGVDRPGIGPLKIKDDVLVTGNVTLAPAP